MISYSLPRSLAQFAMAVCMLVAGAAVASFLQKPAAVPAISMSAATETSPPKPAPATTITLVIDGVQDNQGSLDVYVFDNAQAWNAEDYAAAAAFHQIAPIPGRMQLVLPINGDKPVAIALHHDADGDGQFAMAGDMPLEGYALSGATYRYDQPSLQDALVGGETAVLRMVYPDR